MSMTKTEAKKLLKGDFTPGGKRLSQQEFNSLNFRRTNEDEVYRCCVQTGNDYPQSGPCYCGNIAEFVAFDEKGGEAFAWCGKRDHKPPTKR